MSVVVAIEDVGVCRKQLKIEVPAAAVQAELQRVAEEYRKAARLPGFRKGKVPLEVVRRRFEKEIRQEVIDRLVPRFWRQAEAESELEPLLPPSLADVEFDSESSLVFDAVVEVRPHVELGPIGDFELPQIRIEPTPEEVDEAIEELRRRHGEWVDVDRGAARGDLVAGELTRLGEDEAAGTSQPVSFEVGDPSVWEELTLAATGHSAGGEVELERTTDGETHRYRLRLDNVRERELPPLDDDFAGRVGELEDVAALRREVEERLRAGRRREARRQREEAVLEQLRSRHPLELPQGVVRQETERMVRAYLENLIRQGVDPERAGIDGRQLFEQLEPRGEREVHARLLLDAVAEQSDVQISEAELEASLAALARAQGKSTPAVRQALDRSGRLRELRDQLRRDKALAQLLGESPGTPAADGAAGGGVGSPPPAESG